MPQTATYTHFLRRLVAAIYDGLIVIALWFAATFILMPFTHGQAVDGTNAWYQLYLFVTPLIFFSWFWRHGGQTAGMRAWRIRIVTSNGQPIALWQVWVRYIVAWLAWLSVIGVLWCLIDKNRRGWQDIASRTELVTLDKSKKH